MLVNMHGKWLITWDITVEATSFVFPHRASELREYTKHIMQLFAPFPDIMHMCIIQYDRAVRIRTAQWKDLLLTDLARFSDLHFLWVQNAGPGGSTSKGSDADKCVRFTTPAGK